jgi:hypothetical protein
VRSCVARAKRSVPTPRFLTVIASVAKQSIPRRKEGMGCFVASAQNRFAILSRAPLRKRSAFIAGNDGVESAQ